MALIEILAGVAFTLFTRVLVSFSSFADFLLIQNVGNEVAAVNALHF